MSNSTLIDVTMLSPNHSGQRNSPVSRITPHCVVGELSAESIAGCFASTARQASSNYGIGSDGRLVLIVDENNRSWCSSSWENDQKAVTIECASDRTHPYAFNRTVWDELVELCADICKRHGKNKLLWLGSLNATLYHENNNLQSDEMLLTAHRWFASTACPGDWMYQREQKLADEVTALLNNNHDKWVLHESGRWWWKRADGNYPTDKWEYIDGEWYWFDSEGYAVTGWRHINGEWYWFNEDCKMQTGWNRIYGKWFYLQESGAMKTGWVMYTTDNKWYYLNPENGEMVSDEFRKIDGSWYRFNASGEMLEETTLEVGKNGVIA